MQEIVNVLGEDIMLIVGVFGFVALVLAFGRKRK